MKINKEEIKLSCLSHIEGKIFMIESALNETQASANTDTKSSAGDKHETSRAMAHIENERLAKQLSNLISLKSAVSQINSSIIHQNITLGSYVVTNQGDFFISVGLGKIKVNETIFFAIAINSPVGLNLKAKKQNESFVFQDKKFTIESIY